MPEHVAQPHPSTRNTHQQQPKSKSEKTVPVRGRSKTRFVPTGFRGERKKASVAPREWQRTSGRSRRLAPRAQPPAVVLISPGGPLPPGKCFHRAGFVACFHPGDWPSGEPLPPRAGLTHHRARRPICTLPSPPRRSRLKLAPFLPISRPRAPRESRASGSWREGPVPSGRLGDFREQGCFLGRYTVERWSETNFVFRAEFRGGTGSKCRVDSSTVMPERTQSLHPCSKLSGPRII